MKRQPQLDAGTSWEDLDVGVAHRGAPNDTSNYVCRTPRVRHTSNDVCRTPRVLHINDTAEHHAYAVYDTHDHDHSKPFVGDADYAPLEDIVLT